MDFLALAQKRYSARSFSERKVEPELVEKILTAARLAPTATNAQPQRILVLDTKEGLEKLGEVAHYISRFRAPLCFVICYDKNASSRRPYDDHDYGVTDASIVTTHMALEIADLGLGSTWVGHFPPEKVKRVLNLPESWVPVALLPAGYPDAAGGPHANHSRRKDFKETVVWEALSSKADQ